MTGGECALVCVFMSGGERAREEECRAAYEQACECKQKQPLAKLSSTCVRLCMCVLSTYLKLSQYLFLLSFVLFAELLLALAAALLISSAACLFARTLLLLATPLPLGLVLCDLRLLPLCCM